MKAEQTRIAIIGLGYVGLPLAVEFVRQYPVVGFDSNFVFPPAQADVRP